MDLHGHVFIQPQSKPTIAVFLCLQSFLEGLSEFIFSYFILHATECTSPFLLSLKCHPSYSWLLFKGQVTSTTSGVTDTDCCPAVVLCHSTFHVEGRQNLFACSLSSLSFLENFPELFRNFYEPSYIQETTVFSVSNLFLSLKSKKIGSMETTWSFTSLELSWAYFIWNKIGVFSSAVCPCLTTNLVQPKVYRSWLHRLKFSFCCCFV